MVKATNLIKNLEKDEDYKTVLKKLVILSESFISENIKNLEKKDEIRVERYIDSLFNIKDIDEGS